jgi:hypothetical protein
MLQHYELGQVFRDRYVGKSNLLKSTYHKPDIYVRSIDTDAALQAAQVR